MRTSGNEKKRKYSLAKTGREKIRESVKNCVRKDQMFEGRKKLKAKKKIGRVREERSRKKERL